MKARYKNAFLPYGRKTIAILLFGLVIATIAACATVYTDYTDERMQPLAATASDLGRAVVRFSMENPAEAASLDDRELVRRATAYDPKLLGPYDGLVVRGTVDGVILVCTSDGKRGLFEDAECTDLVDRMLWPDEKAACRFTLKCQ